MVGTVLKQGAYLFPWGYVLSVSGSGSGSSPHRRIENGALESPYSPGLLQRSFTYESP